jgi:exopolysaccharide biosynthesis polyprenyl glycosylphosphotransferase
MLRLRHKLLIQAFRLSDLVILGSTFVALVAIIHERGRLYWLWELPVSVQSPLNAFGAMLMLLGWGIIFNVFVRYDANRFTSLATTAKGLIMATTLCTFLLFMVGKSLGVSMLSKNLIIVLFWPITTLLCLISRIILRRLLMHLRKSGLNCRYVVFVGTNFRALEFARRIDTHPELGYRIAGFVTEDAAPAGPTAAQRSDWPIVGTLEDFKAFLEKGTVDEVMVCLPLRERFGDIYTIVQLCRDLGVVVRILPELRDVQTFAGSQVEVFDGDCVVTFFRENQLGQLFAKRVLDLALSSVMLVMLSPLMLLVALLIKLTSPGPVFFVQERMGLNKRRFNLLKFRSMVVDAEQRKHELAALNEQDGPVFKIRNDPRVTSVGRWIRKTSIDELPQLINVLKGEMSLVGPRPPLMSEVDQYDWLYRRRLSIKPGLTCLWQISGRNNIPFTQWMELDRQYIDNWSIWLDLLILLKTIPVVLLRKGAS